MKTLLIMSTDRPHATQMELHNTRKGFEHYLDNLGHTYEVCEGNWEGKREQSYMITLPDGLGYSDLKHLAFGRYAQDAILHVTAYGGASLYFNDDTCDFIGKFVQVGTVPLDNCYTQSFATGNIYVTQAN